MGGKVVMAQPHRTSSRIPTVSLSTLPLDSLRPQGGRLDRVAWLCLIIARCKGKVDVLPVTTLIDLFGVCFLTHAGKVSFRSVWRWEYKLC